MLSGGKPVVVVAGCLSAEQNTAVGLQRGLGFAKPAVPMSEVRAAAFALRGGAFDLDASHKLLQIGEKSASSKRPELRDPAPPEARGVNSPSASRQMTNSPNRQQIRLSVARL
jgi:hypothetical protein